MLLSDSSGDEQPGLERAPIGLGHAPKRQKVVDLCDSSDEDTSADAPASAPGVGAVVSASSPNASRGRRDEEESEVVEVGGDSQDVMDLEPEEQTAGDSDGGGVSVLHDDDGGGDGDGGDSADRGSRPQAESHRPVAPTSSKNATDAQPRPGSDAEPEMAVRVLVDDRERMKNNDPRG